jgi:hypothetical protein
MANIPLTTRFIGIADTVKSSREEIITDKL